MSRRMMLQFMEQCLFPTLLLIILQGCANPLPPSGGPRDAEAPKIIRTIPNDRTLSFADNTILIEFSEYVDRAKAVQSILLSPSIPFEASWSGKELELVFTESLKKNITYALTIGTDYADFAGNKPSQAHTIIFSTGTTLDSGMISGNIYGQSTSAFVFLLPLTDSIKFEPSKTSTMYKTQIGSNGQFTFNALSNGTYRIYAIQDMFKDGLYDIGTDGYGMSPRDITIPSESQSLSMKMHAPVDTISPIVTMAIQSEKGVVELRCSEAILPESINAKGFILQDESGKNIQTLSAYRHPTKASNLLIEHDPNMMPKSIALSSEFIPTDSTGNTLKDSASARDIQSTIDQKKAPSIHAISVKDSSNIDVKPAIEIVFTHSIEQTGLEDKIKLKKGAFIIPLSIERIFDNSIVIKPDTILASDAWHELSIEFTGIQDKRGITYRDTMITMQLKTVNASLFGAVKGELSDVKKGGPYIIMLYGEKGRTFVHALKQQGQFTLPDIPAGTYTMEAFEDKNEDGKHDLGSLVPLRFSERITQRKETITVRPRWTMDGINIQFREP